MYIPSVRGDEKTNSSKAEEISIKLRSPLEFGLLARGGRQARTDLPPGIYFRRKARNERRGNRFNQSLKEFFLVARGDPQVSAPWLAQQIKKLDRDSGI